MTQTKVIKPAPSDLEEAGNVLAAILEALTATETEQDNRVRLQIAAAATALQSGRDPSPAARNTDR